MNSQAQVFVEDKGFDEQILSFSFDVSFAIVFFGTMVVVLIGIILRCAHNKLIII